MLLGEHAVVRGRPACVCAIDRRLRATLRPAPGAALRVRSALGVFSAPLASLPAPADAPKHVRFLLAAVRVRLPHLPPGAGFDLEIETPMSSVMGLGTSAAVTLATLAVLDAALPGAPPPDPTRLAAQARALVLAVQGGRGSGADVYASAHGGLLLYRPLLPSIGKNSEILPNLGKTLKPDLPTLGKNGENLPNIGKNCSDAEAGPHAVEALQTKCLRHLPMLDKTAPDAEFRRIPAADCPPLTLLYAGYKTPTPEVIARVEARFADAPARLAALDDLAGDLARRAFSAASASDWPLFATCMERNQRVMEDYGVADARLRELLAALRATPGILAAKISGSGLGDCVLALGTPSAPPATDAPSLTLALSPVGLTTRPLD
jgi:mevalonate kinase